MSTVETKATLEAENARLLSRVAELEAELNRKEATASKKRTETYKFREQTMDDVVDEGNRLLHAMAQAFVEEIKATADVVKTVADEAFRRGGAFNTRMKDTRGMVNLVDVENDLLAVVNKGVEKSLAGPQRVLDKFHEVYHADRASA